jgi:hypothetical protein
MLVQTSNTKFNTRLSGGLGNETCGYIALAVEIASLNNLRLNKRNSVHTSVTNKEPDHIAIFHFLNIDLNIILFF